MKITLFNDVTGEEKKNTIETLIGRSFPSQIFFLMIILSVSMAAFGLLLDNSSVVIGSMLIAPILYPILSCSMAIIMSDYKLLTRSLATSLKAVVLSVSVSAIVALFFSSGENVLTKEILSRAQPSLLYSAIAFIAGLAVSFSLVKPELNETLPGVAISVALIPPLAAVGIGIAKLNWFIVTNATVLFLVNCLGIIFANMVVFSLMNFYVKKGIAQRALMEKEKLVKNTANNL